MFWRAPSARQLRSGYHVFLELQPENALKYARGTRRQGLRQESRTDFEVCLNAEALPYITSGRREVSPDEEFVDQHESKVACLLHDFSDARRRGMVRGEWAGERDPEAFAPIGHGQNR